MRNLFAVIALVTLAACGGESEAAEKSAAAPASPTPLNVFSYQLFGGTAPDPNLIAIKYPDMIVVVHNIGNGQFRVLKEYDYQGYEVVVGGSNFNGSPMAPLTETWQEVAGGLMAASLDRGIVIRVSNNVGSSICTGRVPVGKLSTGMIVDCDT